MKFIHAQENLLSSIQRSYDQFHRWVGKKYRLPVHWMSLQNKVLVKDTDLKLPIYYNSVFYGYLIVKKGKLLSHTNQVHLKQLYSLLFNSIEEEALWDDLGLNVGERHTKKEATSSKMFFVVSKDKNQRRQFALALHQSLKTLFMLPVKTLKDSDSPSSLPFTVIFLEEMDCLSKEELQQLPSFLKQLQAQGASFVIGSKYPLSHLCKKHKIAEKDLDILYRNTVEL